MACGLFTFNYSPGEKETRSSHCRIFHIRQIFLINWLTTPILHLNQTYGMPPRNSLHSYFHNSSTTSGGSIPSGILCTTSFFTKPKLSNFFSHDCWNRGFRFLTWCFSLQVTQAGRGFSSEKWLLHSPAAQLCSFLPLVWPDFGINIGSHEISLMFSPTGLGERLSLPKLHHICKTLP